MEPTPLNDEPTIRSLLLKRARGAHSSYMARRYAKPLLAFAGLVLTMIVISLHFQGTANRGLAVTNVNTDRISVIQQRACIRAQVQLANDNLSHLTDYRYFKATIAYLKLNEHHAAGIYKTFHFSQRDIAEANASGNGFIRAMTMFADQKTWIPLSSCTTAGQLNGQLKSTFVAPTAIPFYKRFPTQFDLKAPVS